MKFKRCFLVALLSPLAISLLTSCNNKPSSSPQKSSLVPYSEEERELEIGDTVKEWSNDSDYNQIPLGIPNTTNAGRGEGIIVSDFGSDDTYSLKYDLLVGNNNTGYISSEIIDNPYFKEEDAKNGDVISLYYYVPANSNVASLQLQANSVSGDLIEITEENEEKWIRTILSFDTLETLSYIRVNYKAIDTSKEVTFYIDVINIELGEETVKTDYIANDESLYKAYEDYDIKIGTCLSASAARNTEMRKITKDNFNSITAENEAKPESVLDQTACQALSDKSEVAIRLTPFEKIYNFAEANHIGVRHHTFVWYSQTPSWLFTEDYTNGGKQASRELMLKRMDSFMRNTIEAINDRWPGLVYAIDVVNEAVGNGGAGYNKNNKWFDTIGEDFVYQAFKCASKYKEDYQDLYYNDYDFDYNPSNCSFALNGFLKEAIEEGLIDGVGIQGHTDSNQNMESIITDAKMIYEKGLKCQITELDITVNGNNEEAMSKQKAAYKLLLSKVLQANQNEEADINAVIVWGITDNTSWKRNQNPLLFDNEYGKKPCYYGFLEAVQELEEN